MFLDYQFTFINPPSTTNDLVTEWKRAINDILPQEMHKNFSVLEGKLCSLPAEQLACDCIVSPANSFGIMDGGYDMALSRYFSADGGDDIYALTRTAQKAIQARWRGYAPPGTATVTSLPPNIHNPVGATTLAVVPTMCRPEDVRWHRDLVYNAMWALLCDLERWNAENPAKPVRRVLMTGLATGTGAVSADKAARQMIMAIKHFARGIPQQAKWSFACKLTREIGRCQD
ncbi:macro domain-like protein [Peniophora sp. CONT]|nr:macro domain-like protein [Peniophora sp. CONT]